MFYHKTNIKKVYIGRFNKGDDIIEALENFMAQNKIKKGIINIIGAVQRATIGYYDQKKRKYVKKKINLPMEILNISGNVSVKENKPFVHLHAVFSKKNGTTLGGHLLSPTIVFGGEFIIGHLKGKELIRQYDELTGLFLWQ